MSIAPILWVVVASVVQGQPTSIDRVRELAENGDSSGLLDAVRERPDDARQALRQILERAASTDSVNALSHFASAERLARAYSDVWADSFPLRQVAQFAAWSPPQRSAKVSADSLRRAGNAALGASGLAVALEDWRESYRRCAALADTAGMAAALGNIGAGFYRAADLDSAEAYLDRSRRLAESAGDRRTAVNAIGILASVSKDRGDLQRAREMYTQALAVRQRIGDVRGMAADQNNLGLVAELLGDLGGAREAYGEALALSRTHGLTEPATVALINLGNVASTEGDYGEAGARYGEALEIYRNMGSRVDAAFVLHNLGLLELRRGDYALARARLSEALAIYRQTGPVAEAVSVRRDLAAADAAIGNLETASRQLRRAEQLARRAPASPALAGSLALARADLAVQFNAPVEAGRQYARAEQLYRRANDGAGQAEAQAGKGFVLLLREDYTRARATLELAARTQQALGGRRSAAWTRLLVGDVQRRQGDTAAARRWLTQALDSLRSLNDVVGEAAGLGALGELNAQAGMPVTAESLYRRGLEGLRDRIAPDVSWQLHEGLGRALRSRNALPEAAAELQAAVADVERVAGALPVTDRRTAYRADKWEVYTQLALVERARGRTEAAFEASERMRARQMLDLLARGRVSPPEEKGGGLTSREQDLRRRITELTRRLEGNAAQADLRGPDLERASAGVRDALARTEDAYANLLLELREASPEYATLVTGEIASAQDVIRRLAPDAALLEYLVGDSTSVVFVVTSDGVTALDLSVGRDTLAALVDFARGTLARAEHQRAGATWRAPLRRLFEHLIAPVESSGLLRGKRLLLIARHAELHYLPFAALIQSRGPPHFLIERYAVVYVPSASVWVRLRDRGPKPVPGGVLALAPRSGALPGSQAEVEAIRELYRQRVTLLVGSRASKRALRTEGPRYGVVHLATYGVLNKHNPLFSYVELAPQGGDDGRLEVHEVFGLRLAAELVVLSACQTGLGAGMLADVPAGDDWVGLVQAFLSSGAANVLATLWPVEDQATARLMERFYRGLRSGRTEAAALAGAQRAALRDPATAHPFFWAPFTLVGAGER